MLTCGMVDQPVFRFRSGVDEEGFWRRLDTARPFLLIWKELTFYRVPEMFKDRVVLILGAFMSGLDVSCEVSHYAKKVGNFGISISVSFK